MISTHILDLNLGSPASDVTVRLEKQNGDSWTPVKEMQTNSDGRITFDNAAEAGTYRLNFKTSDYFKRQNREPFFVETPVTFEITDTNRKYHIPLLLNQFGYSTYRGS